MGGSDLFLHSKVMYVCDLEFFLMARNSHIFIYLKVSADLKVTL